MISAAWNEAFFASDVEFDRTPEAPAAAPPSAVLRPGSDQTSPRFSTFVGALSANIIGLAATLAISLPSDLSRSVVMESALRHEQAVAVVVTASRPDTFPEDVLTPGPQNLPALARVLRLGKRADSLDHLL